MKESLDVISKQQKELSTFSGIGALRGWDQMTYMRKAGAAERSEQSALLSQLAHERVVDDAFWHHIQLLMREDTFSKLKHRDQIIVKRLHTDVEKARKIPSDFVVRMAKTTTLAYQAWEEARAKQQFTVFAPHLEKIIALEKEYAGYISLPGHPYNSLLDDYEEGMTVDILKREFSYLKRELATLLNKITESEKFATQKGLSLSLSSKKQEELCRTMMNTMLLPKEKTRLDMSTHPFTTSMANDDVRITTNFGRQQPLFAFFSTIHEAGHALYELGMPQDEYKDTVISDSPSLGMHESQSRFWENMIARSKPFWSYCYPLFKKTFSSAFKTIDFDTWYSYVNQVKPSLIRVEADELTYGLHVILRFELELALIDGSLSVTELPSAWNKKMHEYLRIEPTNDVDGVLQDMHWSGGSFGYFPTYLIGTVYASQLFDTLSLDNPVVKDDISQGNFTSILQWLRKHVHSYGRRLTAEEIMQKTCGEGLNSSTFVTYLKNKYSLLYGL